MNDPDDPTEDVEGVYPDSGPDGSEWDQQPTDMPSGRAVGSDHLVIDQDV